MTLAIAGAWNDANGTVTLTITGLTADTWSITRTDSLGTSSVRTQDGLTLTDPTVLTDHEAPLNDTCTYLVSTPGESATVVVETPSTKMWLGFPTHPDLNIEALYGSDLEYNYRPIVALLPIIDRDDPLPITGAFGTATGRIRMLCANLAEARQVIQAYKRVRIAHFRTSSPPDSLYHTPTSLRTVAASTRSLQYIVEIDFTEVARPIGGLMGTLGWSYADVTALGNTYAELTDTFPTYADLLIGPPS